MPTVTSRPTEDVEDVVSTATVDDPLTDPLSSVAILGATGQSEVAFDGTFTEAFVAKLNDPSRSLDQAMDEMAEDPILAKDIYGETHDKSQAPTIARIGKGSGSVEDSGTKKAVVIGNKDYRSRKKSMETAVDLPKAESDAASMAGALQSRDFETTLETNQHAKKMKSLYEGAVDDPDLSEGDSVVLYFAGHGTPLGVVGTRGTYEGFHELADPAIFQAGTVTNFEEAKSARKINKLGISEEAYAEAMKTEVPEPTEDSGEADILPNSTFTGLVGKAGSKGLNLRIIIDACFSGRSTDMVRDEYLKDIKAGSEGNPTLQEGVQCALELDGWKETLTDWRRKTTLKKTDDAARYSSEGFPAIKALIAQFNALVGTALTPPASDYDPVSEINAIHAHIDAVLNAMIEKLEAIRDGEDD